MNVTDVNILKCRGLTQKSINVIVGFLGVDHPPKTSPKWCPKRK